MSMIKVAKVCALKLGLNLFLQLIFKLQNLKNQFSLKVQSNNCK